jgi:hypothetical protein
MEPLVLHEYQAKIAHWLSHGYHLLADDVDGELRITVHYVSYEGGPGSEREQEHWPMTAELVRLLEDNGIEISRAMAGPRPWAGPHPEELDEG